MAKRNEDVFEAVKKLVKRKPDANVDDALKAARKVDSSIEPDDKRSFNARYLLPAKRTVRDGTVKKTKSRKRTTKKSASTRKKKSVISEAARKLILERDQQILELAKGEINPKDAYQLAAEVDDFIKKLRKVL